MSATSDRESDRDAWLAEALRHAPDAAEAPPPMLRDAILAEARAAALGGPAPQRPSLADRAALWWASLARPPVAAAFATVMVAVLVGVMWHDRPLDETMPPPPPLHDASPSRARETATAPAPATVPAAAVATPPIVAPKRITESRRAIDPDADSSGQATGAATPSTPPATGPTRPRARGPETMAETLPVAPDSLAKAEESQATPSHPQPMVRERAVAATAQREPARRSDADASRLQARPQGVPAAAPAPQDAMKPRADAALRPMASLLTALGAVDARWTQVGPDGAEAALDTSFANWLASVDAAVAGRWQAGPPPTPDRGNASPIELRRDGARAATLRIEDDAIVFRDAAGRDWFATLAPGAAALLRAAAPPPRRSSGR